MTTTQVTTTIDTSTPPLAGYDAQVKPSAQKDQPSAYLIGPDGKHGQIIGASAAIKETVARLDVICRNPNQSVPVIISGETGVGKELVARAIHYNSARSTQPFVRYNAANLSRELAESTLFGHTKGAYTDAKYAADGLFKSAGSGTLFLDEIGELDGSIQAKLLRVLESGEFYQVGSDTKHVFGGRLVVATNKDLANLVSAGKFRDDLFYRLGNIGVHMPPLRTRREDVPMLINHFLTQYDSKHATNFARFTVDLSGVEKYDFPGNVRELGNIVEGSVFFTKDDKLVLTPKSLNKTAITGEVLPPQRTAALELLRTRLGSAEFAAAEVVIATMYRCHGNLLQTSRELRVPPSTLRKRIGHWREHGIDLQALNDEAASLRFAPHN